MPLYQDETIGLSTRDRAVQPPDLLARSGLPVPAWLTDKTFDQFNTDMRRLVARISSLFALIAPTAQGAPESADSLALVAHAPQHQAGGGDAVSILNLDASGLTPGHVIRATAPGTYAFGPLQLTDLPVEARTAVERITLRGSDIAAGSQDVLMIARACTIQRWYVLAEIVTSIEFDIYRTTVAGYPPSVIHSIVGLGNKPKLVAQAARTEPVVGWADTTLDAGDIVVVNIDSAAGALQYVTIGIEVQFP